MENPMWTREANVAKVELDLIQMELQMEWTKPEVEYADTETAVRERPSGPTESS